MSLPASILYSKHDDMLSGFDADVVLSQFKQNFAGDLYNFDLSGATTTSLIVLAKEIVDNLAAMLTQKPRLSCLGGGLILLRIDNRIIIEIDGSANDDLWDPGYKAFTIIGYGHEADIISVRTMLAALIQRPVDAPPSLRWHYTSTIGRTYAQLTLDKPKSVYDAYYPWIEGGLAAYFDRFAASEEVILVLLGEAGTGKTGFIRQLLWHLRWDCSVTYDSSLLAKDDIFVSFMTDNETQVMVVEDADVLLTSREKDRNDMMSRFLNVSDGLYRTSQIKKLIFTANLTQANQIDTALLREGRCFDCKIFRPLAYDEAVRAADAAGINRPNARRDYTLAQLFAAQPHQRIAKMGF